MFRMKIDDFLRFSKNRKIHDFSKFLSILAKNNGFAVERSTTRSPTVVLATQAALIITGTHGCCKN